MDLENYLLRDENLLTPCLLVYPDIVLANLRETIRVAGGAARLRPHVKTHKTPEIVRMGMSEGIDKHKCATLSEASMLAQCGVADVLVAYPQVGPAIACLADLVANFPATKFSTVVDNSQALDQLSRVFQSRGSTIEILLDIDSGMHRTGIPAGPAAMVLYERIASAPAVRPAGLHIYDGQNHQAELEVRRGAVRDLLPPILDMVRQLTNSGLPVPKLVCGGTPTFPVFAQLQSEILGVEIELSPGTCVLNDFNYGRDYPDMAGIQPAALLLTRVVSRATTGQVTVDLGYKAVASDPPAGKRCHFLNLVDAREIQHSEEHLVIESPQAERLKIGDVLYVQPAHVCPTVALHSQMLVVKEGRVVDHWAVLGRDRLYS
jgi:D-serine deaminase-like pyridoxal phosphate-dependent protein